MKAFILDQERVLNSVNDLLKTGVYAENLVKLIGNTPKDKVFTIGVFGGWGTGKSSIVSTAQDTIEKKNKDVKFITYDAWKYANDSFRRMFLLKIQQELNMQQTEEMRRFYQSETADVEPKTTLSSKGVALVVVAVAIASIILFLTPATIEWKIALPTIGTLGTFLLALLNGLFYDLKISYSKPSLFAPEQFEACFKEMMSKCLKRKNWIQKTWSVIKDYVEVCEVSVVGLEKLVIVIDNIDRCPSDLAYQMLTDIKTFLSNEKYNLVFVVPVDDEALKKHLFRSWNKINDTEVNKEKEEFLRKFFNVTLRIKPHQETELLHFAHEINRENALGYSNDTLSIVAKEFADNPRRIIQLLNNLSGDLTLYEEEFVLNYETAICAALILHEEYPTFYKEATKNLNLVSKFTEEAAKDKDGKVNESLLAFMRVADVPLKQTPIDALQRIFTNTSSIFSDLSAEIQKSVTTYDAAKVIEFANSHKEQTANLVDYALEKLNTELKYGSTMQITKWIDFLSQLYKAGIYDDSRFSAIDAALSKHYKEAVPLIEDQDVLNFMGSRMNAVGYPALRTVVLEFLKDEKSPSESSFEICLAGYLRNYITEDDSNEISEVVENYYIDLPVDYDFAYTEIQIQHLFGDTFVTTQIDHLSAIDDEIRLNNIIWCLKNNKKISNETYNSLFSKFIELFGNTRAKTKDDYIVLLQYLKSVFCVTATSKLTTEPQQLYDLITRKRGIPNQSWPNQPNRDTQRSILDEVNDSEATFVTQICYEIMRISGGKVIINDAVSRLYQKCKEAVVEQSLKMNVLGLSLKELSSTLIQADDYDSDNDITLLGKILKRQQDGNLLLDENIVKSKIHHLVDNSTNYKVTNLLGTLVEDEQMHNMVTEYVATLSSETINGLPAAISKYAISTFNEDNAKTYKDNVDFLVLVLKNGTALQIKEVVRLMKDKINNEEDIDSVVLVLNNLVTDNQQIIKNLVSELEGLKDSDKVNEEAKLQVAALVTKLSASIKKPRLKEKFLGKK